jgi:antagonist of KipI
MVITPLGDQALLVTVGEEVADETLARVQQVWKLLEAASIPGIREFVPAATSLGLMLRECADRKQVEQAVRLQLEALPRAVPVLLGQEREIAVCYGGEFGPDLPRLAEHARLTPAAASKAHSGADYRVHTIGFAPGFPYLAGLPPRLYLPRRATPRSRVAAGSVGIGGSQTGIYPLETPGGWQIIGRTPRLLFAPTEPSPAWLQRGDRVRFQPVPRSEYERLATVMEEARRASLAPAAMPESPPAVEVVRPGVQTTVQDQGRFGWQSHGVPVGGAVDGVALAMANVLVGNPADAAALEWARRGPVLRFLSERLVAVTGVEPEGWPAWRPRLVRAGETIDLRQVGERGMRGYLAIAGGIDVPPVLGSRSTCLAGGFGGLRGRTLRAGDQLVVGEPKVTLARPGWYAALAWEERAPEVTVVRVVPGPQADRFARWSWRVFTESTFRALPESDRMGLRLEGATLTIEEPVEMISAAVAPGAVQVPPDGQPIVLLADRQTLGGYPQIGYVITADLPKLAQVRPRGRVRFEEVSLDEAERARHLQNRDLQVLGVGVMAKLQAPPAPAPTALPVAS